MSYIDPLLIDKFGTAKSEVAGFLRPVQGLDDQDARKIIQRYVAVFEGNFLSWMSGGSIAARSVVARFAADENLLVELKDDHPGMLRTFAISCAAEPGLEEYRYVQADVDATRELVRELSGLKSICLMGLLENTSVVFIPYLAELGKKLGCKDFTYTDIHGEADVKHADQFLEALSEEQKQQYVDAQEDIDSTIYISVKLLRTIFS